MECTSLIVYDDWQRYLTKQQAVMLLKIQGYDIKALPDKVVDAILAWFDNVSKVVEKLVEEIKTTVLTIMAPIVKGILGVVRDTFDTIKCMFDNAGIQDGDSDIVIATKVNHYAYTKHYISEQQWYDNQFKLMQRHICIRNKCKR